MISMRMGSFLSAMLALVVAAACSSEPAPPAQQGTAAPAQPVVDAPAADQPVVIAFLGDSLTAGLGLLENQAYPARVGELFAADGYNVDVINGGISGDTTAGGVRRYDQLLTGGTRILVVALGANDALRGLTVRQTHDNLAAIVDGARAQGIGVVVAGMEAPTNLGEDYRAAFHNVFVSLVREYRGAGVVFVPFLLEGVAGHPELNQADGIHPNEEGAKIVASLMYPPIKSLVDRIAEPR
jgi:acyl-CoA thioesterase-1